MNLKLATGLAALLAIAIAVASVTVQAGRINALKERVARFEACEAAVAAAPKARPPAEVCSAAIAAADRVADRALSCDRALGQGDLYGIEHSCSTPVKTIEAKLSDAADQVEGLTLDLQRERQGKAAALRDAERRGQLASERKARADAAVAAAPRDGDGLRVHGSGSLCARWGCPGDAQP